MKCPFCAEEILEDAKKCRYCGEWLTESKRNTDKNISDLARAVNKGIKQKEQDDFNLGCVSVVIFFISFFLGYYIAWWLGVIIFILLVVKLVNRYNKE